MKYHQSINHAININGITNEPFDCKEWEWSVYCFQKLALLYIFPVYMYACTCIYMGILLTDIITLCMYGGYHILPSLPYNWWGCHELSTITLSIYGGYHKLLHHLSYVRRISWTALIIYSRSVWELGIPTNCPSLFYLCMGMWRVSLTTLSLYGGGVSWTPH